MKTICGERELVFEHVVFEGISYESRECGEGETIKKYPEEVFLTVTDRLNRTSSSRHYSKAGINGCIG